MKSASQFANTLIAFCEDILLEIYKCRNIYCLRHHFGQLQLLINNTSTILEQKRKTQTSRNPQSSEFVYLLNYISSANVKASLSHQCMDWVGCLVIWMADSVLSRTAGSGSAESNCSYVADCSEHHIQSTYPRATSASQPDVRVVDSAWLQTGGYSNAWLRSRNKANHPDG